MSNLSSKSWSKLVSRRVQQRASRFTFCQRDQALPSMRCHTFRKGGLSQSARLRPMPELSDAKRRIVEVLKRAESATAQDLAEQFSTTTTAVRQHLDALEQAGLVERFDGPI